MEHARPKMFDEPAHPSWRESEVSPKLYSTGYSIYRCTGESSMINDPKRESHIKLYLMPGRLNALDNKGNIPLLAESPGRGITYLTWSRWSLRNTSYKVSIPPSIIVRWYREQFPNNFDRSSYICCRAHANNHNVHLIPKNSCSLLVTIFIKWRSK